ncbi:enoyl-CoA hydratase [Pseudarthrobacter sulfonivorans]|uniref:enoyl-CoA hydratase n=1 Tax=Pseudarthrobacter sulfonivorans TaxID=121292 RepID=A0A0U3GL38_9MICC|nr:enoyl-CoA hydratase/isomerase family protein [Pseudarthrobacter sulfonivorans]ALV39894.1 enoyl-CoA hydratase [Pseudarthrobacter sulfonivorans]
MSIDLTVSDDGIATIVMNRPERMNAFDAEAYKQLSEVWIRVRDDHAIRVAVITGAGEKAFSAGADLKDLVPAPPELHDLWLTQKDQLLNRGLEIWKPVIAAVNGYCLGGGLTMLFATDIRIACHDATFGLSEVKRGVLPGNGATQRVIDNVSYPRAMEMLLTGEPIDASKALEWGLINEVVDRARLMERSLEIARQIAANAPLAVQATKELAVRSRSMDLASGLRLEQVLQRILQTSEDAVEGPKAFAERRPAVFGGR